MPLYRVNESGHFLPFEETPFPDLERVLEDWIEANPHLLLHGETIAFIGRQPRTQHGKFLDLLGVDVSGACIIVELKRGETPRDVVAQALEYAAWVDALTLEQLDEMAREYAAAHQIEAAGVAEVYHNTFATANEDEEGDAALRIEHISFNTRQRLVIVAERFSGEIEQTIRYLRTRLGVDITAVQFGVHKSGDDMIVQTNVIVGREHAAVAANKTSTTTLSIMSSQESDDHLRAYVTSDFLRTAVTAVEEWVEGLGNPDLSFQREKGKGHRRYISVRGRPVVTYYFAKDWMFCWVFSDNPKQESQYLREHLSKPEAVRITGLKGLRLHIATEADFNVLKQIILAHVSEKPFA